MLELHSKIVSAIFSLSLLCLSIICYALLVLLFVTPASYNLDSLTHPNRGTIQPSVAVGILSTVLIGATTAFVTRCVEQSLWLRLSSSSPGKNALTVQESHQLAQWSVSPLERLLIYPVKGSSWLLRLGGIVLFGTAAVNPVLLSGISQRRDITSTVTELPSTVPMASNRLDVGNSAYRGGQARDNPTLLASLAEMSNLTASILDVCNGTSCHIEALTTAIKADCSWTTSENPNGIALIAGSRIPTYHTCSSSIPTHCVTLRSGSPNTYANFSSTWHPDCFPTSASASCEPGAWSSLLGAWVSGTDTTRDSTHDLHTVECLLTFGNVTVSQNGTNPPTLDRTTFVRAPWSIYDSSDASFRQMNRIYTESGAENSPYSFSGGAVGTGDNSLYRDPLGYMLLGTDATFDARTVAGQIERNFDRATLSAYARLADASMLTLTMEAEEDRYVYEEMVLLVLLVPLVATLLGAWGRWRVGGEEVVVGYSPVEMARRGPVVGLPTGEVLVEEQKREFGRWKVWGLREGTVTDEGRRTVAVGYAAGREIPSSGSEGERLSGDAEGIALQHELPKRY